RVGSVESLEGGPIDQRPAVMRRLAILCRGVDARDVALADGSRLGDLGDVALGVLTLGLGDLRDPGDVSAGPLAVSPGDLGDVAGRVLALGLGDLGHLGDLSYLGAVALSVILFDLGHPRDLGSPRDVTRE